MSGPPRVLILGLDGATLTLLSPGMDKGLMPHLDALRKRGLAAPLRSTCPPETGPAWSSLCTGCRPERHGIFAWSERQPSRYQRRVVSSSSLQAPTFWSLLRSVGISCGTFNVPLTWPLDEHLSFGVSGLLTPPGQVSFAVPPSLQLELTKEGYSPGDLRPSDFRVAGVPALLDAAMGLTRARARAFARCLGHFPWQVAMAVFEAPDRVQHVAWKTLYEELCSASGSSAPSHFFFRGLDEAIGEVLAVIDPDTHVYVVSDHGFGAHEKAFFVNEWLHDRGFLALHPESSLETAARRFLRGGVSRLESRLSQGISKVDSDKKARVRGLFDRLYQLAGYAPTLYSPSIDWRRTVAFAPTPHGLVLNLKGREPLGILSAVEKSQVETSLIAELLSLIDPVDGKPLHAQVLMREQAYFGPCTDNAPDLVFRPFDPVLTWKMQLRARSARGQGPFPSLLRDLPFDSGTHREMGILIAAGPEIRSSGFLEEPAAIEDIVPTLLAHFGLAAAPWMDGHLLSTLFREDILARRVLSPLEDPYGTCASESPAPACPDDAIEEQLRQLGYLS